MSAPARGPLPPTEWLQQRHEVETPEHVELRLELAVSVVNSLVSIALAPVLPCMLTLFYYDLRMRREGFDLQVLGQQLGIG